MNSVQGPDYKRIYSDIIRKKLPHKEKDCRKILNKDKLQILDILTLNKILFGNQLADHKYKSYDKRAIKDILEYQRKHELTNMELARIFSLSRNTITRWKKIKWI